MSRKSAKCIEILSTDVDSLQAEVTYTPKSYGNFKVKATGVDSGGNRLEDIRTTMNCVTLDMLSVVKIQISNRIGEIYRRKHTHSGVSRNNKSDGTVLMDSVMALEARFIAGEFSIWASSSAKHYFAYFRNNVLPVLQEWIEKGIEADEEQFAELRDELETKHIENKNSGKEALNARNDVQSRFYQANIIINYITSYYPEVGNLPTFPIAKGLRYIFEPIKSINPVIELKLRRIIEEVIEDNPILARAAAIAVNSPRPSEAVAVQKKEIHIEDGYMWIDVIWQEDDGKRIKRLKSSAAYRKVVLDEWAMHVIESCNKKIENEDPQVAPMIAKDLSTFLKKKLIEAGLKPDKLAEIEEEMIRFPEYDENGRPERDIVAYILRRNYASKRRSFCGYTETQLDLILGHGDVKVNRKKFDLTKPQNRKELALKNRQYDIDIKTSKHPGRVPIIVYADSEIELPENDEILIKCGTQEGVILEITCDTFEPGDSVSYVIPVDAEYFVDKFNRAVKERRSRETIIESLKIEERINKYNDQNNCRS